jgi:hypothetical protein
MHLETARSWSLSNFSGTVSVVLYDSILHLPSKFFKGFLTGQIPSSLGNCKELMELTLFENKLSGTV